MEYTLFYPTPWDQVAAENDNIDVCLTFPDGRSCTFAVAKALAKSTVQKCAAKRK